MYVYILMVIEHISASPILYSGILINQIISYPYTFEYYVIPKWLLLKGSEQLYVDIFAKDMPEELRQHYYLKNMRQES